MIDIHAPHESVHTWRDVSIHLAIVVVGILIAIGLEQSVEAIHHAQERRELRAALQRESRKILDDARGADTELTVRITFYRQAEKQISETQQTHHPMAAPPRASLHPWDVPDDPTFKAAKASGKLSLLSDEEVVAYSELDACVVQTWISHQKFRDVGKNMGAFVRVANFGRPAGTSVFSPGATPAPAELKEFYTHLVASDEQAFDERDWSRQAGAAASVLVKGEFDLQKIQAAELETKKRP